jgi:hypothetical protein
MINQCQHEEIKYTRAEVRQEMGVRSRSTLNAYCNYLKIPARIRYFTEEQHQQLIELRHWVLQGYSICDFLLKTKDHRNCA